MEENIENRLKSVILILVEKCEKQVPADNALKYTQAALNVAHTLKVVTAAIPVLECRPPD